MRKRDKFIQKLMGGKSDATIDFSQLLSLLASLGFDVRTEGSHHVVTKDGVEKLINLQPDGRHVKPFQVKQVRAVLAKHKLAE
ncbi:MAG TPA: type II toxin-antitoxin system HicA family toxin [Chloroflexota bacterium]|nr:type II toxin-antitoxin system HicA family toxin [Chloroflexota bacterium]